MSLFPGIVANQPSAEAVRRSKARYAAEQKLKAEQKEKELKDLARPLVEYLQRNYYPRSAVVITDERNIFVMDRLDLKSYMVPEEEEDGDL